MFKRQAGFTIVELLIVVVIIAVLAAITVVAFNGIQQRTRDTSRISDVTLIKKALSLHKMEHGFYPTTAPNPGSSTWEISTDPNFLLSLNKYTSSVFKAPGQQTSQNAYWYHSFSSDSGCPEKGAFAIIWVRGMESQPSITIKNRCTNSAYFDLATSTDKSWYVEYLY